MEPLSPNDPVFKVLGNAKPVEPRPNFTQNVLRAVRQVPQRETLWERCQSWFSAGFGARGTWAGAGLAVAAALAIWVGIRPADPEFNPGRHAPVAVSTSTSPASVDVAAMTSSLEEEAFTAVEEPGSVATQFDNMDQLSLLLAQQDTSALTDSEIALLLY